ncbi:MAG: hypothetical protein LIO90_06330 [Bacteroidales bacterium]|nr:hypothetical protein [Bacteroidales bacterium]
MHQDLARTEKRLANVGSRIAVPAILCYCCFITLFLSLAFLIMTIWAIGIEDYGQKIAATAIKFGWITGIVNAIILAYSIWHHRH